jgi:hypothetical protein
MMPDFSAMPAERMGIAAYETTTEGTPVSPVFPDTARGRFELVDYCRGHANVFGGDECPSLEAWSSILFGEEGAVVDLDARTVVYLSPVAVRNH